MLEEINLKKAKVFENVEPEMVEEIARLGRRRDFKEGEVLFRAGQEAQELLIIHRGRVALSVPISVFMVERELQIDTKGPGDLLGWSSLVEPHKYTLTARGLEPGEALVLSRKALLELCQANPSLGYILMSNLARIIGERLMEVKSLLIKEVERSIRLV